jgi:predicted  nucleic acid-binding Zn-ribbon protein
MSGPISTLRELHRLRKHVKNLKDEIERLPRQLRVYQGKVVAAERTLTEAQDGIKHVKVTVHQNEVSLKEAHQQAAKYEKQLNDVTGKKEYDALQSEIAHAKAEAQRLEDEILAGMTDAEERQTKVPELELAVKKARDEVANFDKTSMERKARLTEELTRAEQALRETEPRLTDEFKQAYDRLVKVRGEDALAATVGRTCSGCNTAVTAQKYNDLLSDRLVVCRSCERILYLPAGDAS